jgi:hypothetical protein
MKREKKEELVLLLVLERIERELRRQSEELEYIREVLAVTVHHQALSATLTFEGVSTMPATILVGGKGAKVIFTEYDGLGGTGNTVAPIQPPVFSSSDATVASTDQSGNVTAVAVGSVTITVTDEGNGLTASDSVSVLAATAGLAKSATAVATAN